MKVTYVFFGWNWSIDILLYIKDSRFQDTIELGIRSWKCYWSLAMLVDFHATKYCHLCAARNTVAQTAAPERKSCQSNCHQWPEPNLGHVFPSANQCINLLAVVLMCTCWLKIHTRDGLRWYNTGTGTWSLCEKYLCLTFLFITSCLKDLIESTGMQQRHLVVCNLGSLDVLWNRLTVLDKRIKAKI